MKFPKNFDDIVHQQTLSKILIHKKRSNSEANCENDSNENSQVNKFKSPRKLSPLKSTTTNATSTGSQIRDFENSNDNNVIVSSQDNHESKLKIKFDRTLSRRSKTPQSTPQKLSDVQLADSPNKKLSFSEVCDVSSTVIKEEIVELLDDMKDFESIEMTHNLSDLFTYSPISSNILHCTSPMDHVVKIESLTEDEDASTGDDQLKDPLQIDENIETEGVEKAIPITKEKPKIISKTIAKSKLKHILPISKNSSNDRQSHKVVNKNKLIDKSLKKQEDKLGKEDLKANSLSGKLLKILKTFKVELQHVVPPQHMIENSAGARNMDQEQIAQFEKYGPLKRGPYAKEEDEIIKKNWQMFCDVHDWDENNVEPFLYMRHDGKYYIPAIEERKRFVRFLANGLPWRSLYSVHRRFRTMYNTTVNNGQYTAKEDKKILSYMKKASSNGVDNKCAELAKLLNRKRQSIWARYQKLKRDHNLDTTSGKRKRKEKEILKKKKQTKIHKICFQKVSPKQIFRDIKWTSPLVKKFIDSIMELTACKELVELKNQKIESKIWKKMEKKMSIDKAVLQNFWCLQLHMQLFCPTPIYLNDTKVKLIEHMYTENIKGLEDINWESVCVHFNGLTSFFLSKLFDQLLNCAKKNVEGASLSDALEYLHTNYVPMLNEKSIDAILPKLFYHSGKIICIDKGSEKKIPNKFTTNPFCEEDES